MNGPMISEECLTIIITIFLFIIGAILGSFACCQAWRIRYKELGKKSLGKRSVCLACGKKLKASENIPIFSWLFQKGKCRSCGAKIGKAEILSELGLGISFAGLGLVFVPEIMQSLTSQSSINSTWEICIQIGILLMLIAAMTVMWILLVYDAKWQVLPTKLLTILNACAIIIVFLTIAGLTFSGNISKDLPTYLLNVLESAAILAGVYLVLYLVSKERLVGSGDWLLALPIALILGRPILAMLVLFLSNFFASIYGIIRQVATKKKHIKIPFGPFLVLAFIIVALFQNQLNQLFFTF